MNKSPKENKAKGFAKSELKTQAFRGGSYSLVISVVVLAIIIVINLLVSSLPVNLTKYDISAAKLYSITSNTKVAVNSLEKDVTIYWIVQADQEDDIIENLLAKYKSLSKHINVVKKNPDVYPTFVQQYTDDENVMNNSLIVECGEVSRYIPYTDIFVQNVDMYSYSYTTSFDGEGAITSAIEYVVSDDHPQIYCLEGHGEVELPSSFADQIKKDNFELNQLSLLTVDKIPDDAACIIIFAPQSDISSDEMYVLRSYVRNGGKLLVMAGPVQDDPMENLYGVISYYGVSRLDGVVVEADQQHYMARYPYYLLPTLNSNEITDPLIEAKYSVIMPLAQAMKIDEGAQGIVSLLDTTMLSYNKSLEDAAESLEMAEGDVAGPFSVAVSLKADEGHIVWFSCANFMVDQFNAYSSGANCDLAMNSLASLVGESKITAIRSKSLNYNYLTINESQGSMLKIIMIFILPLLYLAYGIAVVVDTRRKQNAAH